MFLAAPRRALTPGLAKKQSTPNVGNHQIETQKNQYWIEAVKNGGRQWETAFDLVQPPFPIYEWGRKW